MRNEILKKPFLKADDLCILFDVGKTKAYELISIVKVAENIDEKRLPVKCCVPTFAVIDYFQLNRNRRG